MRAVIERFLQKQEKKNLVARVQKSQILMSFLTLIVCVGVLCTGSWAYFTDSATVSVEKIQIKTSRSSTGTETESSLVLLTTVKYIQEEPEAIAETEQPEEENGADSEEVTGEPQEITEELTENIFTALQDGKYQFTMVFSGNAAGYGKITVTDGKATDGTKKIYVTEVVNPIETESVEYSVIIQLAKDCTVSFEACLGEVQEDLEAVEIESEGEILFSELENTEESPTEGTASDNSSEEQPTEEPSEEEPTEGETSPEAGEPVPETGNQEPEAGDPAPEDGEPAPQTEPQPQAAEEETEVSEE